MGLSEHSESSIQELDHLLRHHFSKDKRIIKAKISNLTAPGENYGSTMMRVDLTLEDENKYIETLCIVAKMIPETEFFQEFFNVQLTFKLEVAFYEIIIPTLQNFQRDKSVTNVIDCFPKFFAARMNLTGSEKVDRNGVILLENLKVSGEYLNI